MGQSTTGTLHFYYSDGGIAVSIVAFQAIDPGSTPGHRKLFLMDFMKIILFSSA